MKLHEAEDDIAVVSAVAADQHLAELIARSRRHPTPIFLLSTARVRENYRRFTAGLPGCRVFYALKANSHPVVLAALRDDGSHFDAASLFEVRLLLEIGVPPERIAFTTPVKPIGEIRRAAVLGVRDFVADNPVEIDKLAEAAPGCNVLIRIQAANTGSQWPLSRRFGAQAREAVALLRSHGFEAVRLEGAASPGCALQTHPRRHPVSRGVAVYGGPQLGHGDSGLGRGHGRLPTEERAAVGGARHRRRFSGALSGSDSNSRYHLRRHSP